MVVGGTSPADKRYAELVKMTVKDLKAFVKTNSYGSTTGMVKADLIALILSNESAGLKAQKAQKAQETSTPSVLNEDSSNSDFQKALNALKPINTQKASKTTSSSDSEVAKLGLRVANLEKSIIDLVSEIRRMSVV